MIDIVYSTIGFISAIIGIVWFLWDVYKKNFPFKKLSWKIAEKKAQEIANNLIKDHFFPTLIVGIGRGGAIFGAMISGCLGHCPLLVVDREYKWKDSGRIEDIIFFVDIPTSYLDRVLLVAGEIHSGKTMKLYYNYFRSLGAKEIRKAVLFFEEGCPVNVEYIGIRSTKKNILMPWMFSKNYIRADRSPPEPVIKEKTKLVLYLVRHGRTAYDDEDKFCGISDPDLSEEGIEQAIALGRFFRNIKVDLIYTSELKRAIETAKIIQALNPNTKLIINRNLNEMNFGKWEGLTRNEIKELFPEEYAKWETDPFNNPPPEGEHPKNVLDRMQKFLEDVKNEYDVEKDKNIVCVTHKTSMRLLLSYLEGVPLSLYRQYNIDNGTFVKLVYDGEKWIVEKNTNSTGISKAI